MSDFPIPAYELADIRRYMLGSLQYSSAAVPISASSATFPASTAAIRG